MNPSVSIFKRFSLLTMAQILNLTFPLALYFLLLKRIEIARIGEIMSWQTVFLIIASISNYNFPLNLIPISQKLKNSNLTLQIYWKRCLSIRIYFLTVLISGVFTFQKWLPSIAIYSSLLLVGKLYNPTIFLSVLAKNRQLLWFNFLTKLTALIAVYFLVQANTWYWTNTLIGISELLISMVFLFFIQWNFTSPLKGILKTLIYLKKQKKNFSIQSINALIVFSTIPLTHLFFGANIAGIISIADRLLSFVKTISGSLFFAILPNFENLSKVNIKNQLSKLNKFLWGVCLIGYLLFISFVNYNKSLLIDKFTHKDIVLFLGIVVLAGFPIILATPFQLLSFKKKDNKSLFKISAKQFSIQILGLLIFGTIWGILGIAFSIVLHETLTSYLYKKEQMK